MTNYDFLLSLTKEEIAQLLAETCADVERQIFEQISTKYPELNLVFVDLPLLSYKNHLDWLNATVEEEKNE